MNIFSFGFLTVAGLAIAGCSTAPPTLFPPDAVKQVVPSEFGVVQAQPDVFKGQVVQLAGRIVGVESSGDGYLIRAQELPMQTYPVYGPVDKGQATSEFAISYKGKLDPKAVWYGNKLLVVAVAQGDHDIVVGGAVRSEPLMVAKCMHVWKTGGYGAYEIADFPHTADGYYPLEQQTYCIQ